VRDINIALRRLQCAEINVRWGGGVGATGPGIFAGLFCWSGLLCLVRGTAALGGENGDWGYFGLGCECFDLRFVLLVAENGELKSGAAQVSNKTEPVWRRWAEREPEPSFHFARWRGNYLVGGGQGG